MERIEESEAYITVIVNNVIDIVIDITAMHIYCLQH